MELMEKEIKKFLFKYEEDKTLEDVKEHIKKTYTQHYTGKDNIQIQDVFDQLGIAEDFARGAAMKYLYRFGKKQGKNKEDLLKCIHYICLLYYYSSKSEKP